MYAADRPPIRLLRAFSTPKYGDAPNEDRWRASEDGTVFAVSDGASISFDSALWAEILTRRFIDNPIVTKEWLDAAIGEYTQAHDREAMAWMQEAAFDRGSFASLLGVVCSPREQTVRVIAIGDSLLAITDGDQLTRTIPYIEPEQFDQSPNLLSTNPAENRWLDEEEISRAWQQLQAACCQKPGFLLMTDAIGRWLLDQPDRVARLLLIPDAEAFDQFIERERIDGGLRRDDSTLIVLG